MASGLILQFATGIGSEEYGRVNSQLGLDMATGEGDWPHGLKSHAAGISDDGTFVVSEIWESREDQTSFLESRLGPALQAVGVPAPTSMTWFELISNRHWH